MKVLNGNEIAGFIKERQAQQVKSLISINKRSPRLAIILTIDHPVINVYVRMKQKYGRDINIDVDIHKVKQSDTLELIDRINNDSEVDGVIVQLPLEDPAQTDYIVDKVLPQKDVDALGKDAVYDPATPMAIMWLLAGYNVELRAKKILLIGRGKLVGAPLERIFRSAGLDVSVADRTTKDLKMETIKADIIISAAGSPALLYSDMIKRGTVIVDAGIASEDGKTVGDVAPELYERDDLTITPTKGGVGPLTVCALFDNVIRACQESSKGK